MMAMLRTRPAFKGAAALAIALAASTLSTLRAQGRQVEPFPYTPPAVFLKVQNSSPDPGCTACEFSAAAVSIPGDAPAVRQSELRVEAQTAYGVATKNSFGVYAKARREHEYGGDSKSQATALREFIPRDPLGRGEITLRFQFKAEASSAKRPSGGGGYYYGGGMWAVLVGPRAPAVTQVWIDVNNMLNPVYAWDVPPMFDATLFAVGTHYTTVEADRYDHYRDVQRFTRSLDVNGHTVYFDDGEGPRSKSSESVKLRVIPGARYVMWIEAIATNDAVSAVDPIVTADPENPEVTIEFPDTLDDPNPRPVMIDTTPEELQEMGIDPQSFIDLGFLEDPSNPPAADPPPPAPPAPADTTPPDTLATPTPVPATGWTNAPVTVSFAATDEAGGSGVKEIRVTFSGAASGSRVIAGNAGSIQIAAEGTTIVNYSAVDNAGNVEAPKMVRLKIDSTAPALSGLPSSCTLWNPNHELVPVALVSASDSLSGIAGSLSIAVTSNEPATGLGDGDLAPDVVVTGGGVKVRAERSGSGNGRVYVITATATDLAGNITTASATCNVPHDIRK